MPPKPTPFESRIRGSTSSLRKKVIDQSCRNALINFRPTALDMPPESPTTQSRIRGFIEALRKKLIDQSGRNTLINFCPRPTSHIEFLNDRLVVPISYDRKENRYLIDDDFAHIPPLELKDTDCLLLSFLQQCLAPHQATEIGQEMIKSFERLFGVLSGSKKWKEWAKSVLFRFENQPQGAPKEVEIFNLLYRIISQQRVVSFSYKAQAKPPGTKRVKPLLMMMQKGRWYLYGVVDPKKGITSFSFNRISEIEITSEKFRAEELTDPRILLHHSFGVAVSSDPPFNVVLEFESQVVDRVKDSLWHSDQKLEDRPGGKARLTLPLNNTLEIQPWILSWGPYVKVMEPEELAVKIQKTAKSIAERYSEESSVCYALNEYP